MSVRDLLLQEIPRAPETVLREVWHYLRFLEQREGENAFADILPGRDVEQEVLEILDRDESNLGGRASPR